MKIARNIGVLLLLAPAAAMAEPVALVLDVQGEVSPPVAPYVELEPGAELTLAPDATLVVAHYASCVDATVHGGTVRVDDAALDLSAAGDVERRPADCPEVVPLSGASVSAGVVLRGASSAGPAERIGLAPAIVVAGDGTGIDRMRIERAGREVATLPVLAGRVAWPVTLSLADGERYRLILSDGAAAYRVDVVADEDAPGRLVLRFSPAE